MHEVKRNCPECGREIVHKNKVMAQGNFICRKSNENGILCRSCAALKRGMKGNKNPFWGKVHTSETIAKLKEKCSVYSGEKHCQFGKPRSDETKRKCRVAIAERFLRTGIGNRDDEGAFEYFWELNPSIITNYYLQDIGYFVDGYDIVNNISYEYDTKYHSYPSQKKKDDIRQKNIVDYFKQIDNPLSAFVRIDAATKQSIRFNGDNIISC